MVNTQIIANELNNKLNTIANVLNLGHQFKLMAHIGKAKQSNAIEGILKPVNSEALSKGGTDTGTVNSQIVYVAEVVVPTAIDNKSVLAVEDAITKLVHDYNGYSFVNGSDNIIWELSMGTPKDYAMRGGTGLSMPMAFTVKVSYSDVGLINGIKAWTLDGEIIPYTGEGVILDKEGVTLSVLEAKTQQTIPTSQRKQYKFTIPYDKTNVVCTTLQNDILNGDFRKTYTLAYNDGVITYSAKVSLFKTGDIGSQKTGDATMLNVSFVDAGNYTYYDEQGAQINYQIGLINFPFDDQSENTLYFDSQATQQAYMESKVFSESTTYLDMTAPNLNTTLLTNVVYDAGQITTGRYDLNRLSNLNYAIIKKTIVPPNTIVSQKEYYYYWVQQCTQGADGILLLDLKLDTIQTYMFNPNLTIPDCLIERAHLNRWIDNGDETVSFDGTPTSKLFTREDIRDVPKRVVSRQELTLIDNGLNTNVPDKVRKFFDRYVLGWLYATFQQEIMDKEPLKSIIAANPNIVVEFKEKAGNTELLMPYVTFAFPLYKTVVGDTYSEGVIETYMQITNNNTTTNLRGVWDANVFIEDIVNKLQTITGNVGTFAPYILSMQIRQTPPINFSLEGITNLSYDLTGLDENGEGVLRIIDNYSNTSSQIARVMPTAVIDKYDTYYHTGLYVMTHQIGSADISNYSQQPISTGINYTFEKSQIVGATKNYLYNPKLLGEDFTELKLGQGVAAPFSYDAQKLGVQNVMLAWRESIFPGVVKSYIGLYVPTTNGQDSIYNEKSFNGFVGCNAVQDTSIPYNQDQMETYLQQNKNFYLQQGLSIAGGVVGGGLSTAAIGAIAGSAVPGIGTIIGATVGLVGGIVQAGLTINNMQNKPDELKNIDGNPMLQIGINNGKTYLELSQALEQDLEKINNTMFMNGFSYNQLDDPLNYIHTRKYFNYIKAQLTDIQGVALSNLIRNDIKQRFSNGLRFWDASTFATNGVQYDLENYELWLED